MMSKINGIDLTRKQRKNKNINTLSKITKNLPSIIKSQKIQEEVSKDGFDFKNE